MPAVNLQPIINLHELTDAQLHAIHGQIQDEMQKRYVKAWTPEILELMQMYGLDHVKVKWEVSDWEDNYYANPEMAPYFVDEVFDGIRDLIGSVEHWVAIDFTVERPAIDTVEDTPDAF